MEPKIIRVIAPLPPKGNVAARHAAQVIYHLDKAGFDTRPATTTSPSYSLDKLGFAPKATYQATRERLLSDAPEGLVLYPEGLDFRVISQDKRWHRWLEGWRRLGLVWRLLRRAKRNILVFRPRLLRRFDHFMIVALGVVAKLLRPRRVKFIRQSRPAEAVVAPLLGHIPAPCSAEKADLASLNLAVKHGASGGARLTPVWLRAALGRLSEADEIRPEIAFLCEIIESYGEANLPVLNKPSGYITAPPFADQPAPSQHGVPLTAFMMHIHQARRLAERFPLDTRNSAQAYHDWYLNEAPLVYEHSLFCPALSAPISSGNSAVSISAALHLIVKNARFWGAAPQVSPDLAAWFNAPLHRTLTRLEFLIAVLAHAPLDAVQDLVTPWQSKALKPWFAARAFASYPLLAELAGLDPPPRTPALHVVGNSHSDTGLGQNRKMSEKALLGVVPKRNVYLHHINADGIPAAMLGHHEKGAFHIGYLLWEMEQTPEAHELAGQVLDEVWAPTAYVQKIYQKAYACPVTLIGKGFSLPPPTPFDLARFGISPEQPVFLVSFDLHSSVARKNPLAAVLAFQMAFERNPEARLIIKTSKPPKNHWGDPEQQMSIIKKLMARDKRIILFQEHLPFRQYLGLIGAVHALVSPHRAEGFGYVPAYAMALNTAVIATDYSGTQDFCTEETALCVPWRKRAVRPGEPIYPLENAFWAEIDHEALARAMKNVLANPVATTQRSAAGQALISLEYSEAAQKKRYIQRLKTLGLI